MINGKRIAAVVLAAGNGRRMQSSIKKQYMMIRNKPVIYYSLKTFEDSFADEIILVVSKGEIPYCRDEIVKRYDLDRVTRIVEGGKERYHSVYQGIRACSPCDYVYIHDGARPMLTGEMLNRLQTAVETYGACVAGMPSKDTVKIADENGMVQLTPDRNLVWTVQTPQVFSYSVIKEAYERLMEEEQRLLAEKIAITDDAMVVETLLRKKIRLVEGDYRNIKITTPEDLKIAEEFLKDFNR